MVTAQRLHMASTGLPACSLSESPQEAVNLLHCTDESPKAQGGPLCKAASEPSRPFQSHLAFSVLRAAEMM